MSSEGTLVYVCSCCGSISFIEESCWLDAGSAKNTGSPNNRAIDKITGFSDMSQWKHGQDFQRLVELSNSDQIPRFPLCQSCIDSTTQHIIRLNGLFSQFLQSVDRIEKCGKTFTERCLVPSHPQVQQIPLPPSYSEMIPLPASTDSTASVPDPPFDHTIHKSMTFFAAFRISFSGIYGTINSLRLGFTKACPVPFDEVQNAIYFLCRYLFILLSKLNLDSSTMSVTSKVVFTQGQRSFELKFPERKMEVDNFNCALTLMMATFQSLFEAYQKMQMSPPNPIQLDKLSIGGQQFTYSSSEPINFTNAMRKLLINLKAIQVYSSLF